MSRRLHSASFTGLSTPMRKRLGSRSSKFKYAISQIVRGLAVGKCVENFARGHRTIWFHFRSGSMNETARAVECCAQGRGWD